MSYLIDTDIIIYSIKEVSEVLRNFQHKESEAKALSVITYGELLFAAKKSKYIENNLAIVYRIKEIFPIIEIDNPIIETFSGLKSTLQKAGKIIDDMDLLIASTALTHNLVLVTNNVKHFKKVKGLKIENWTKTNF